jgi:hypothetical protein
LRQQQHELLLEEHALHMNALNIQYQYRAKLRLQTVCWGVVNYEHCINLLVNYWLLF